MTADPHAVDLSIAPSHASAVIRRWARKRGPVQGPFEFGPCGMRWVVAVGRDRLLWSIIVTQAEHDGAEWLHASIAGHVMPSYEDLTMIKAAFFGPEREAYQVFPPSDRHVSIHDTALHLWGRADGAGVLPPFGADGTI